MAEEIPDYEELAKDINLDEVTSCRSNAIILRMLRDGDDIKGLDIVDPPEDEVYTATGAATSRFFVGEEDDLGWLGYFIGKSEIESLTIAHLPEGSYQTIRFFDGISQNRYIKYLHIYEDIGTVGWSKLGCFLENHRDLLHLEVLGHLYRNESAQNLALALGQMNDNFLTDLRIINTNIGDERFVPIAAAIGSQPQLERLFLYENNIGRNSCVALGNSLRSWPASNKLETLYIEENTIDDRGLQALAEGLMNCRSLNTFYLNDNPSITAAGLRYLSPLLQSEAHSLDVLRVTRINWGDDGAIVLADGLRGNESLTELRFRPSTAGMTSIGWSAFSNLLCDTSTINSIYFSNHKVRRIGCYDYEETPEDVQNYLRANRIARTHAVVYKIFRSHPDLDMEPFFTLNMKFLPLIISWFERVEFIEVDLIEEDLIEESERSCQSRKLSALYKFVRGMPDLTADGYWEGRLIEIKASRRRIADERRRLDDEELRLEYEEQIALERSRPMDEANRNKRTRYE